MKIRKREIALILVWVAVIVFVFIKRDSFTAENIINLTPENRILAVLFILLLFALKSVSVVIHNGVVYTAAGMMFPFWDGMVIGCIGTLIMVWLPYLIGSRYNLNEQSRIAEKYPRIKSLEDYRRGTDLQFVLFIRFLGLLPNDVIGLYMGMKHINFWDYTLGSVASLLPGVFVYVGLGYGGVHGNEKLILAAVIVQGIRLAITAVLTAMLGKTVIGSLRKRKNAP